MKKQIYHFLLAGSAGLLFTLSGCTTPKVTIKEGQRLYGYDYRSVTTGQLTAYHSRKSFKASLKQDSDGLYITADKDYLTPENGVNQRIVPDSVISIKTSGSLAPFSIPANKAASEPTKKKFFFSISEDDAIKKFVYTQWKPYVQGMVVPIKLRLPVGSISAQAESGPTVALAPGFKHTWNKYRGSLNALGLNTNSTSISAGFLIGVGSVDINAKSTQNQVADADATKNVIIPLGIHVVGGYNNFNVGIAAGIDLITGPNGSRWNYNSKLWLGLIVGLDIIK